VELRTEFYNIWNTRCTAKVSVSRSLRHRMADGLRQRVHLAGRAFLNETSPDGAAASSAGSCDCVSERLAQSTARAAERTRSRATCSSVRFGS